MAVPFHSKVRGDYLSNLYTNRWLSSFTCDEPYLIIPILLCVRHQPIQCPWQLYEM